MSYRFTATLKSGYLHCVVNGENSVENVTRYMSDVYGACIKNHCPNVLMEKNLTGPGLKLMEIYSLVSEGSQKTWPHVKRIAYVDNNPEHSESNTHFGETVARNRGVLVRSFRTVEDAEQWLQGELGTESE